MADSSCDVRKFGEFFEQTKGYKGGLASSEAVIVNHIAYKKPKIFRTLLQLSRGASSKGFPSA